MIKTSIQLVRVRCSKLAAFSAAAFRLGSTRTWILAVFNFDRWRISCDKWMYCNMQDDCNTLYCGSQETIILGFCTALKGPQQGCAYLAARSRLGRAIVEPLPGRDEAIMWQYF